MTTPKEKAEELIEQFENYSHTDFNYSRGGYQFDSQLQNAKQCALIAVDEIIKFGNEQGIREPMMYWHKVKEEVLKL